MTKKELSQLYYLNREIAQNNAQLTELEAAATNANTAITGLPHSGLIPDKTALAAEIADLRTIIEAQSQMCIVEYNRIQRYIATLDDSLMRQIIKLRHINGLTWHQVAQHIGGGNTEGSIKMIYHRNVE